MLDWHAPLNHANAALRDDGLLVIAVPNLRYWKEVRKRIIGTQPHWLRDMTHIHGYTPSFIAQLLTLHGFRITNIEADRLSLPLLGRNSRWRCRTLATWGSVLIISATLARRCVVVDQSLAWMHPNHKPVKLRSIEISS